MHTIQFSKEAPHLTLIAFFRDPSRVETVVIYSVDVLDFQTSKDLLGLGFRMNGPLHVKAAFWLVACLFS